MSSLPLTFNNVTPKQILWTELHLQNVCFEMMKQENKIKLKNMYTNVCIECIYFDFIVKEIDFKDRLLSWKATQSEYN